MQAFAPQEIPAVRPRKTGRRMQFQIRIQINEIGRLAQTRFVEVFAARKQRIKRVQVLPVRVPVAAGDVGLEVPNAASTPFLQAYSRCRTPPSTRQWPPARIARTDRRTRNYNPTPRARPTAVSRPCGGFRGPFPYRNAHCRGRGPNSTNLYDRPEARAAARRRTGPRTRFAGVGAVIEDAASRCDRTRGESVLPPAATRVPQTNAVKTQPDVWPFPCGDKTVGAERQFLPPHAQRQFFARRCFRFARV